ncbi:hypothetical protein F0562_028539 [Nyssa sinensis]|uniref:V-type proton ATPase subunit a n=1 Tax=Nyssa sinensis TaxID=561372 RepID=A0A5J5B4J0_9ASTE|nr:hypothetical protein F0562_028539 [Nyssa sinensis]
MFLSRTDDLGENPLFVGQKTVQLVLLLLALVAIPWMLFPKPFLLKKQHQDRHHGQSYTSKHRRFLFRLSLLNLISGKFSYINSCIP